MINLILSNNYGKSCKLTNPNWFEEMEKKYNF